jgi:hypothetical protein
MSLFIPLHWRRLIRLLPALTISLSLLTVFARPPASTMVAAETVPAAPVASPQNVPLLDEPTTPELASANDADWDVPPMFFRPSQNNFIAGDEDASVTPNDPINVIVYGPNLTRAHIQEVLIESGPVDDIRTQGYIWQANEGIADFGGVIPVNCANIVDWAPGDGADLAAHVGSDATTACPAIRTLPLEIDTLPLYRLKTRYWQLGPGSYPSAVFPNPLDSVSIYVAAGTTENLARLLPSLPGENPYAPLPDGFLACGKAHCLTDFDEARDIFSFDLFDGAFALGWTIQGKDPVTSPVHSNLQDGPYTGTFDADGDVRIICLDPNDTLLPDGTPYCAAEPAQRPIAISGIAPGIGGSLAVGKPHPFEANVTYSDGFRSIASVSFNFDYQTTGGTKTASVAATAPDTERNEGVWTADVTVPTDAQLFAGTTQQQIEVQIEVCDSEGACWTRKNLNYFLANTNVLIAGNYASSVSQLSNWLTAAGYSVTTMTVGEPTAADLAGIGVLVLALPDTANNLAGVQDFVNAGGSVLVIGDYSDSFGPGARPYIAGFGMALGSAVLLSGCSASNTVNVVNDAFGVPVGSTVNVAATNTIAGGTPILQTSGGQTVVSSTGYGAGRAAASGDVNIFGGCNYAQNQDFALGLFGWLSRCGPQGCADVAATALQAAPPPASSTPDPAPGSTGPSPADPTRDNGATTNERRMFLPLVVR